MFMYDTDSHVCLCTCIDVRTEGRKERANGKEEKSKREVRKKKGGREEEKQII